MRKQASRAAVVCLGLAAGLCQAQVINLSGVWKLNVARSSWGKKQKPVSVFVEIDHREPAVKYQGTVVDSHGDGRYFEFEATLDGKEYPFHAPYGEGAVSFKRLDAQRVSRVFRSSDGQVEETVTMRVSADGKVLTQRLRLKDPAGEMSWTEVYEKK